MTELLALVAAVCLACGSVAVKLGTSRGGDILLGFVSGLTVATAAIGTFAVIVVRDWSISWSAVMFFFGAGLVGPAIGRYLLAQSVHRVGASVTVPVQSSTNPLVATLVGVTVFAEPVRPDRLAALALILIGIALCARGGSANRPLSAVATSLGVLTQDTDPRVSRWLLLVLPMATGAAFAASDILRKFALNDGGHPVIGSLIGTGGAWLVWLVVLLSRSRYRRREVRFTPAMRWFLVNGLLTSTAQLAVLFALRSGELSVISPIVASQPVVVLVLSALVLREVETLRRGTLVGSIIVFMAVVFLAVND